MTTTRPNFGDVPWPERDLDAQYDHERAAKESLGAAGRIYSQAKVGAIPFDINVITAAQVNATIGVGEAVLAPWRSVLLRPGPRRWLLVAVR
jgi:hypothetical protein